MVPDCSVYAIEKSMISAGSSFGEREAYGGLNKKEMSDCQFVGELSLDAGVRGVLPIAGEARGNKIARMIVPEINAREAATVGEVEVSPVRSLVDVIHFISTGNSMEVAQGRWRHATWQSTRRGWDRAPVAPMPGAFR